jgi:hypothetical protein
MFQRNERREREQRELAKQAHQAHKCEYIDQLSSFDGSRSSSSSESDSYTAGTQVPQLAAELGDFLISLSIHYQIFPHHPFFSRCLCPNDIQKSISLLYICTYVY